MSDIAVAFELLAVGMITVFIILFLVYLLGYLIILTVNKYLPSLEPIVVKKEGGTSSKISSKNIAILTAVVNKLTQGNGHISQIEKLKNNK